MVYAEKVFSMENVMTIGDCEDFFVRNYYDEDSRG